jgi:hypothetical protein
MKRGRGGRGRVRTRKNAIPISSGETLAKKRGRLAGNTPEMKEIAVKTPPNFSPVTSSTHPLTHCSKPSIEKNSRTNGILGTNEKRDQKYFRGGRKEFCLHLPLKRHHDQHNEFWPEQFKP